jgi:hypothetical protein
VGKCSSGSTLLAFGQVISTSNSIVEPKVVIDLSQDDGSNAPVMFCASSRWDRKHNSKL